MKHKLCLLSVVGMIALALAVSACSRPGANDVQATAEGGIQPCTLDSALVADVTVPAGSELPPQTAFEKTWRVQNSGTCSWGQGTQLVYVSGATMGSTRVVGVPPLAAGSTTEITVNFAAPPTPGTYTAHWQLRSPDGRLFGAQIALSVVVSLPTAEATAVPTVEGTATPTARPTVTPEPEWDEYREGDGGPAVVAIQYLLRTLGYPIEADSVFGSDTDYAVRRFQTLGGLTSDGIVGPATWAALIQDNQVETGSRGDAVRAVQYLLTHVYGYSLTVNGIFDADTDRAVRDFQASHGLVADGLVGPHTWKALVARP